MIPLMKPDITFDEVAADIRVILDSGWLTSGSYVKNFERQFADYIGTRYAVSTTSATTALHMSLIARGIGRDDEVLVSDFTFPASGNVITQTGATPVLVDCCKGEFVLDLKDAQSKLSSRTKALMIVHPFGQPVNFDELTAFARQNGLWILEDAACAITSNWRGTYCGRMGDAACFSFHPRKILTTGEGGMIVTDDHDLYEQLIVLRSHGGKPAAVGFEFVSNGFNYRMSEIQAALGLAQLRRIDQIVAERRRIAAFYLECFANVDFLSVPHTSSVDECSFQSFVVLLNDSIDREAVIARMKVKGVEATLGTYAMHAHPAFSRFGYKAGDLPNSLRAQQQSLTLPLFRGLTEDDVLSVVNVLQGAVALRT